MAGPGQTEGPRREGNDMAENFFDFGYAMTTHKAQGSGFQHAIVYVDRPVQPESEDWRRWMYTAVTRAAERLTVIL
jgi:exodeoxyribonuclease V